MHPDSRDVKNMKENKSLWLVKHGSHLGEWEADGSERKRAGLQGNFS